MADIGHVLTFSVHSSTFCNTGTTYGGHKRAQGLAHAYVPGPVGIHHQQYLIASLMVEHSMLGHICGCRYADTHSQTSSTEGPFGAAVLATSV